MNNELIERLFYLILILLMGVYAYDMGRQDGIDIAEQSQNKAINALQLSAQYQSALIECVESK